MTNVGCWQGATLVSLLALSLSGCGGGGDIEVDVTVGPPPEVSLSASAISAPPGGSLLLSASVIAANGVDHVSFYRVDSLGPTLLDIVYSPPAQSSTTIPVTAVGTVIFYAHACDLVGLCTDSAEVSVNVAS
jgi:hypothetical protein